MTVVQKPSFRLFSDVGAWCSAALACAWLVPGTLWSALLGWIAAVLLVQWAESSAPHQYRSFFVRWFLAHTVAFYWVGFTVSYLSGLSLFPVLLLFSLFCALNTLQFLGFLFLFRNSPRILERVGLRAAVMWTAIEILPIRIFPWQFGHTQFVMSYLVQLAEITGVAGISFLLLWCSEGFLAATLGKRGWRLAILPAIALSASCIFGEWRIQELLQPSERYLDVTLVQPGHPAGEDLSLPTAASVLAEITQLTQSVAYPSHLVVWPETVLLHTVHESVLKLERDPLLPRLSPPTDLLLGALTHRFPTKRFNSAILIRRSGEIPLPYHKRVLIPFGEYTPYESLLPFLKYVNPNDRVITRGQAPTIFDLSSPLPAHRARIAPLICYEDLLPRLVSNSVAAGGEVLISISNHSWLKGPGTVALYQHQVMAAFRAIESRRPLIRVSNTGISSVVDATGKLVQLTLPGERKGVVHRVFPSSAPPLVTSPF